MRWIVYDHPSDYPGAYVARKWVGDDVTDALCAPTITALRDALQARGVRRCWPRHRTDVEIIVETWWL